MSEVENKVETTETETKEAKTPSKTDIFKAHLQAIIKQSLGIKVSKDTAWNLFKDITNGTVEFTLNQEDNKLPLAGVGNFEVLKTEPRKSKAGLVEEKDAEGKGTGNWVADPNMKAWEFVPRYRFYPSVAIERVVEHFYGLGDHKDLEVKHYGLYAPVVEETEAPKAEKAPKADKADKAPKAEKAPKADKAAKEEVKPADSVDVDINIEEI